MSDSGKGKGYDYSSDSGKGKGSYSKGKGKSHSSNSDSKGSKGKGKGKGKGQTMTKPKIDSQLLVGFMGRPSAVTHDEIAVLEKAFKLTYESLACGDRTITSVKIDTGIDRDYKLPKDSDNTRPFTFKAAVTGQCHDCGKDARLFWSKPDSSACHPPTEEKFVASYNKIIKHLKADGKLENVVSVTDNFAEMEDIDCSDQVEMDTQIRVSFQGGDDPPSPSELYALQKAFEESYNEANNLNSETCDPLLRGVFTASFGKPIFQNVTLDGSRRLNGNWIYNTTTGLYCLPRFPSRCASHDKGGERRELFSDTKDFPLSVPSLARVHRKLQFFPSTEECICPIDDPDPQGPTEQIHLEYYNQIIQFLRAEGTITSITSVVDITYLCTFVDGGDCIPFTGDMIDIPSDPPSDMPADVPSEIPSPVPTPQPS